MTEIMPMTAYPSKFTQQCFNCDEVIHAGNEVVAGAINFLTKDFVWMHPRCAQLYRVTFGTRDVFDNTWRVASFEQRCKGGCEKFIVPGEKLYRRWTWGDGLAWHLTVECHGCHRSRNGATVELPT